VKAQQAGFSSGLQNEIDYVDYKSWTAKHGYTVHFDKKNSYQLTMQVLNVFIVLFTILILLAMGAVLLISYVTAKMKLSKKPNRQEESNRYIRHMSFYLKTWRWPTTPALPDTAAIFKVIAVLKF